jgi:hypothetical protein
VLHFFIFRALYLSILYFQVVLSTGSVTAIIYPAIKSPSISLETANRARQLIAEQAGVIGLFVDAKDNAARRFYVQYGFLTIPEHPLQLFLPIETVRAAY